MYAIFDRAGDSPTTLRTLSQVSRIFRSPSQLKLFSHPQLFHPSSRLRPLLDLFASNLKLASYVHSLKHIQDKRNLLDTLSLTISVTGFDLYLSGVDELLFPFFEDNIRFCKRLLDAFLALPLHSKNFRKIVCGGMMEYDAMLSGKQGKTRSIWQPRLPQSNSKRLPWIYCLSRSSLILTGPQRILIDTSAKSLCRTRSP